MEIKRSQAVVNFTRKKSQFTRKKVFIATFFTQGLEGFSIKNKYLCDTLLSPFYDVAIVVLRLH